MQKKKQLKTLDTHREEAATDYNFYKQHQKNANADLSGGTVLVVMDLAENVLLSSMMEQPGNLHFNTGLKFDIFGVSSSIRLSNFLFGLPEAIGQESKSHLKYYLCCTTQFYFIGKSK